MGEDQSRQALAWMWEGRQGKKPHSHVSPRGREDRGEAGPRGGCGPAWPPSPRPLRVASVFRNVLSLAGAAKANGQGPGRGPGRWLAALTFSWPGPASPVDAAPRPWGAPAMQERQEIPVQSLSQEDPLEKEMATHSSSLA